jgi:hypothetical protein
MRIALNSEKLRAGDTKPPDERRPSGRPPSEVIGAGTLQSQAADRMNQCWPHRGDRQLPSSCRAKRTSCHDTRDRASGQDNEITRCGRAL